MIPAIDRLSAGDTSVVDAFVKAREFWKVFFEAHKQENVEDLANSLSNAQAAFEHLLDLDRYLAKSIMAVTCLGALYDDVNGFGNNGDLAHRIVDAFRKSSVSLEVKFSALDCAETLYHLKQE